MRLIWNSTLLGPAYKYKDGKYLTLKVAQQKGLTVNDRGTKRK